MCGRWRARHLRPLIAPGTTVGLFQSAMSADDTLAARSHARISASPASRAATQNLTDFTGTLYPPIGGPSTSEVRVGSKPRLPPRGAARPLPSSADIGPRPRRTTPHHAHGRTILRAATRPACRVARRYPRLSKVQSVDQRMRLECGVGFRQLRTCRRIRPGQLCAMCGRLRVGKSFLHVCSIGRCSHVFGL